MPNASSQSSPHLVAVVPPAPMQKQDLLPDDEEETPTGVTNIAYQNATSLEEAREKQQVQVENKMREVRKVLDSGKVLHRRKRP